MLNFSQLKEFLWTQKMVDDNWDFTQELIPRLIFAAYQEGFITDVKSLREELEVVIESYLRRFPEFRKEDRVDELGGYEPSDDFHNFIKLVESDVGNQLFTSSTEH